ncbi:AAA family ATPase [Frankia sp. CNm7]|uniref:AAA family ATPase n=1 Tax=Frankia nepalensis TaxID=1836974 RepID=A0A937RB79_9ACTN|nr:AAA family ATPase [Frankia nepalensis]MBL7501281.1 AAA family ATPase [Frankia nepalensis]MBL7510128.1 AAA family ATPase [Frankia nepalensis]MBL7520301.1 AAA family ATPase [Frankia nepalensis]MBL7627097.1 AAA family ATPase [Frankia nepalensis]
MGEPGLVGRRRERVAMSGWLDAAFGGAPALVLCGGEPGIGKTRLATEAADLAAAAGALTRWARAHEGVGTPPFWLWRQLLRSDLAGEGSGPPDLPTMIEAYSEADRFALFDAVVRRVFALAERRGLLLVVEDAQWADEPSLLLLRYLARELRGARLLVLVTYRTVGAGDAAAWRGVLPDLGREPVTMQVPLAGLDEAETAHLVRAVTGAAVADDVASDVHRRTSGNPFFVRELARMLTTDVTLSGRRLPASLVDVVGQRAAGLSEPARRMLGAAAVLGEQFSVATIAAMVATSPLGCLPPLEEAAGAGLVVAADTPGDWRFAHALVCEAIEADTPAQERVRLHRSAAEALERVYAEQIDDRLADIARHWAAAALDDPAPAVAWARRAAAAALRSLAYEESARLYQVALDAGGPTIDQRLRCDLLIGLAGARWRARDMELCRATTTEAIALARRIGRADLIAEAALGVEPVGTMTWDLEVRRWCDEALAGLDPADLARRARLLARSAEASVYLNDSAAAEEASREALALADGVDDPIVVIAALRSRQLCRSGPEHVDERGGIADRMTEIGRALRRPREEMWGRLWRIDTFWERGDLAAVTAELPRLGWCVDQVGGPIARWHLLVTRAALAGALGRYDEALEVSRVAYETLPAANHPTAFGVYSALLVVVAAHVGHERVAASQPPDLPTYLTPARGEARNAPFRGHLGTAYQLVLAGRREDALAVYLRAGPVDSWPPPAPYWRVPIRVLGSRVAVALGRRPDVERLYDPLLAERGRFAVGGAGTANYLGPVELHLGQSAAFLGRLDDAVVDLDAALAYCRAAGAAGFAVETACELAAALTRRAHPGDLDRARQLLDEAEQAAGQLGMDPWASRARDLLAAMPRAADARPPAASPLSPREAEVAELVAGGLTNRQIAAKLFISERTAQTHVQHILTRLGFSSRTQIATWVSTRHQPPGP